MGENGTETERYENRKREKRERETKSVFFFVKKKMMKNSKFKIQN